MDEFLPIIDAILSWMDFRIDYTIGSYQAILLSTLMGSAFLLPISFLLWRISVRAEAWGWSDRAALILIYVYLFCICVVILGSTIWAFYKTGRPYWLRAFLTPPN